MRFRVYRCLGFRGVLGGLSGGMAPASTSNMVNAVDAVSIAGGVIIKNLVENARR